MKKLKVEQLSHYSLLLICALLFNCQKNDRLQQNESKTSINDNKSLSKEAFFKCTTAKDTVFKNGDYVKFIPINNKSYGIEIKLNDITDILDNYSFDCNSYNGMIPKLLFKTDYIVLSQGSSTDYRYLIICNANNKLGKIDVTKFETEIVENSGKEFLFFKKGHKFFFFNMESKKIFSKELPDRFFNAKVEKFELYKNKVIVVFTRGDSLAYKLNEFK
ncbi:MAG: hypothetical protein J7574_04815 [Flavobacterium sp.]|uniref:hypothetical protein n=1 Tax=Flavobacterium sp. TaxID=239 RepID=UPI001B23A3FC|nr:hypothetical protein [Flavobacterium sp.]MBO9583462.1 hypothetical protein [Flavobacterium sp.]